MSQQLSLVEQRESARGPAISRYDRILGMAGISVGVASLAATGLILWIQSPENPGATDPVAWIAFGLAGLSLLGVFLITIRHFAVHAMTPGLGWLIAGWVLVAVTVGLVRVDFALTRGYIESYAGLLSALMGACVILASVGLLRGHPKPRTHHREVTAS